MTDEFKRRQAMINLAAGEGTQEDVDALTGGSEKEVYGRAEQFDKDGFGLRVEAEYRGYKARYFVPKDCSWISGRGIQLDKAYRVFSEDEKTITAGEVRSQSELGAIVKALWEKVRGIVKK